MIYLAVMLLAVPLLIGLTLALFIAEQKVMLAKDLHWLAKGLLLPWLWLGFLFDVLLNATLASFAFMELPREWTLSARIKRHIHESAGWRFLLATWICENWLRPIDEHHCE